MHVYDPRFYEYINEGAGRSARAILPVVARHFNISSVVDFGAGQGAWLREWRALGVSDVLGVDGSYVDRAQLLIPDEHFVAHDLRSPIQLGRRFDLVQSLEVAEHLPEDSAETFVHNLTTHGDVILFSAAAPGQGGLNHLNERPYEYWREMFAHRRYLLVDIVRPAVAKNHDVEPWYRHNTLLFIHERLQESLSDACRNSIVPDCAPIPDVSSITYRLRKNVLRLLPVRAATRIAIAKKHLHVRLRRSSAGR